MRPDSSEFASIVIVHIEQFGSAPSDWSQTDDPIDFHGKVFVPTLRTGMKQRYEFAVHMSGQIRSLMEVAPMACETKI